MDVLLGDIGGTHARLARASEPGRIEHLLVLDVADYADLDTAIEDYFKHTAATPPAHAAFAVAGPVSDGEAAMTNIPWKISARELANRFGFTDVHLVNDFAAVAMAIPALDAGTRRLVGGGAATANAPAAVLGPGTGLGVAALIPTPTGPVALASEGGHATLAAATPEEDRILARLREQFGHVSAERVLSGPGIEALYAALAGNRIIPPRAVEIGARAVAGTDPEAVRALAAFFAFLGSFAGNLVLTLGARNGLYIAGGIVPALADALARSSFRERFEAKGRFASYLKTIPTYLIAHPQPALLGLSSLTARKPWN